jgi:hypothetical protein
MPYGLHLPFNFNNFHSTLCYAFSFIILFGGVGCSSGQGRVENRTNEISLVYSEMDGLGTYMFRYEAENVKRSKEEMGTYLQELIPYEKNRHVLIIDIDKLTHAKYEQEEVRVLARILAKWGSGLGFRKGEVRLMVSYIDVRNINSVVASWP